jgi:hypothetical protein
LYDSAPEDLIISLNLIPNKRIIDCLIPLLLQKPEIFSDEQTDKDDWSDVHSNFSVISLDDC